MIEIRNERHTSLIDGTFSRKTPPESLNANPIDLKLTKTKFILLSELKSVAVHEASENCPSTLAISYFANKRVLSIEIICFGVFCHTTKT